MLLICFYLFVVYRQREGGPRKRKSGSSAPKRKQVIEEPAGKFKSKAFLSSSESDSDEDRLKIAEEEARYCNRNKMDLDQVP